jgi:Flp pilus assembly protein TadD
MKTNKKGEFMQIGLSSGPYKVTATKDKLTASQNVRITQGRPANAKLVLGAAAATSPGEAAAVTALRKVLDEAIAATNAGKFDEAIAGFTKAGELQPTRFACFYNIGYAQAQRRTTTTPKPTTRRRSS